MINAVVNVLKPTGLTSSDVVVRLKRIYGQKKVGHMGTLDPMGAGVLLVGLGKAARLFDYFLQKQKEYYATFRFGAETDTLDSSGKITATTDILPSQADIKNILNSLIGQCDQMPPKYSAKSVGGIRAYDLARSGVEFELKPKSVEITKLEYIREIDRGEHGFRIECSGGTYIRSICRDLAYALNTLGHMTSIVRTRCGSFKIEDAITLEEIERDKLACLTRPQDAVSLPSIILNQKSATKILNGIPQPCQDSGELAVYNEDIFLGIGKAQNNLLKLSTRIYDEND